jgi:hypothetical protein
MTREGFTMHSNVPIGEPSVCGSGKCGSPIRWLSVMSWTVAEIGGRTVPPDGGGGGGGGGGGVVGGGGLEDGGGEESPPPPHAISVAAAVSAISNSFVITFFIRFLVPV